MSKSELYQRGEATRRKMYGDDGFEKANREVYGDPVMQEFVDVATETVFGALWSRPGLDLKTRALVCVVSDVATGREAELAIHLRFALGQGWTEKELIEVMLQLSGLCWFTPRPWRDDRCQGYLCGGKSDVRRLKGCRRSAAVGGVGPPANGDQGAFGIGHVHINDRNRTPAPSHACRSRQRFSYRRL